MPGIQRRLVDRAEQDLVGAVEDVVRAVAVVDVPVDDQHALDAVARRARGARRSRRC